MRMPRGFHALIAAQFCSALADNALLIVCIALLLERGLPGWWAPMLKFSFTIAYVVLAPFVGALADAWPKARLMMAMNGVKVLGLLALLVGLNPLLALLIVGVGAAAYAPAKYGLVTELVPARGLVAANAWFEVTTVCAAVFGTVIGGGLVSAALAGWVALAWPDLPPSTAALVLLLALYALAAVLNLAVPDSGVRYAAHSVHIGDMARSFVLAQRRLWADPEGALSMSVTTLFWGAAAVREARSRGVQSVVCGHIHHAEMRLIDGVLYCNDGDWVESLTALVEHDDGRLEIVDWSSRRAARSVASPAALAATTR